MRIRNVLLGAVAALLCPAVMAQGSDSCSTAQVINGLGTFSFDNTSATLDGPPDCSGVPVRKDVWFLWTAPASTGYSVQTCGGTSLATRLALYDGNDCATYPLIDCVSSNCNQQSKLGFLAVAGNEYLIRLGSKQFATSGSGTFDILPDICQTIGDDSFEDNDDCPQATPLGDGSYPGLIVHKSDPDWYAFDVADGATLQVDVIFTNLTGDIDCYLFDSCGGNQIFVGGSGTDNELILWDNTLGCDITVIMRLEHWQPDTNADCNNYDMIVAGTGGTGGTSCDPTTVFCDPANANSTGVPAILTATGSFDTTAGTSPVHIECVGGPQGLAGYYLISAGNTNSLSVSQGVLCLTGPTGRYNPAAGGALNSLGIFDAAGVLQNIAGTSVSGSGYDVPIGLPAPPGGNIISGSTWYFQVWYRDINPTSVSNFSNGVGVTFN
ncbi:MAG: hypothetical protein ACI8QC_000638 [Planctomycetota bacterium]|jgi:hypothetical protein